MTIWRLNPKLPVTGQAAWLFEEVPNSVQIQTLKLDLHPPLHSLYKKWQTDDPTSTQIHWEITAKTADKDTAMGTRARKEQTG